MKKKTQVKDKPIYRIYQELWCSDDCGFVEEEFNSVKEAKTWIKEHKWEQPRDFIKYEIYKFIAEDCIESDEVIEKAQKIAYKRGSTIINAEDIKNAKNEN